MGQQPTKSTEATASERRPSDRNAVLKIKFQGLHATVVNSVNTGDIIDFLFQEGVLGSEDTSTLHQKSDPQQQCRDLLALLHTSENPEAFVKLYRAIKNESSLQWLVDRIDKYSDQSVIDLQSQQRYTTDPTVIDLLKQRYASDPTVGQLVHTLPEGESVWGVTSLAGEIYLLRDKERDQVEVYDVITYRLQRCLTVPNIRGYADMTSCEHNRCAYICDPIGECVHRLDVQGAFTRWTVNDEPGGLSVNAAHNVVVTCRGARKIKEFSSRGEPIRKLTLPDDIINPYHAILTRSGQFVVCNGDLADPVHRVCMMSADGRHIVHSHGGQRGSGTGQCDVPKRLAVDDNEFVFVADLDNRRVTLLSPTLEYVSEVVSRDQLKWRPYRLYLDTAQRLLYVAENEFKVDKYTGRVVVFSV